MQAFRVSAKWAELVASSCPEFERCDAYSGELNHPIARMTIAGDGSLTEWEQQLHWFRVGICGEKW
jgi:hypothetical protein